MYWMLMYKCMLDRIKKGIKIMNYEGSSKSSVMKTFPDSRTMYD